ncbi:anaerobic ribonucleoside-triphosphate reductase [Vibrio phage 1.084.O._10N.261.49.F5]|nr:anaerobic ribonucleoside-triphosphate reductase [Vibrio phage 1.084.O._10N.261.49.F5]
MQQFIGEREWVLRPTLNILCRSFLHPWKNSSGEDVWDGRNNLGVVSVNLPRIAIESKGNISDFYKLLDEKLEVCKTGLMFRIERLRGVKAKVAPILYCEGALGFRLDPEDEIMQVFENGRASISLGYIGLNEMCNSIFGVEVSLFNSEEKQKFAEDVVSYLKSKVNFWKEQTGWAFSLYSTPSESLCDRFCKLDEGKFGVVDGVTTKGYYTNSFHLDVNEKVSPTQKIDFEQPYHQWATGGHITYVEVPNINQEMREVYIETCWDYASEKVPYFGTNCVIDYCHSCNSGMDAVVTCEGFSCPHCGNTDAKTLEVTKRVCGYLGSPNARPFVDGKQKEVIKRVKHS